MPANHDKGTIQKRAPSPALNLDAKAAETLGLPIGPNAADAVMAAAKAAGYRARVGGFSSKDGILTIDLVKE